MTAYVAANVRSMVALLVADVTMFAAVAPASARTIKVNGGDDLQAAIDRADGGDTVTAGANFTGPFTLPVHQGRKPVTIRSSRLKKLLRGRRVRARDARFMPRLLTPGRGLPVLATSPRARGWRLAGLNLAVDDPAATVHALVAFGDGGGAQDSLAEVPRRARGLSAAQPLPANLARPASVAASGFRRAARARIAVGECAERARA